MFSNRVAIIDYTLGNLHSVQQACRHAGLRGFITSDRAEVLGADAVILPGVGAFGDAMASLQRLDLVGPLRDLAGSNTPLIGICLGQQLLMTESSEFGNHRGLGIIDGEVVRFASPKVDDRKLKVPQVGWNCISRPCRPNWQGTLLENIAEGEPMYFVHSYYVKPADEHVALSTTRYGDTEFCSSIHHDNVHGFQFHPERSAIEGLKIYRNLANFIRSRREESRHAV